MRSTESGEWGKRMKKGNMLLSLVLALALFTAILPLAVPILSTAETASALCPNGHTWGEWEVLREQYATCTEPGMVIHYCTVCGMGETAEAPPLGHDYIYADTKAATCTAEGVGTYTCWRCGESYSESTPALGHYYDYVVTQYATCIQPGILRWTCVRCGDSYDETVAYGDHYYEYVITQYATCTQPGIIHWTCAYCGNSYDETVPAQGHDYTCSVTKAAACAEDGENLYTCTRCGDSYTEIIPSLGHDWDNGQVTKEPTCIDKGEKSYTCRRCGRSVSEIVAPLEHNWDNGQVTKAATCKEDGEKTYACRRCNDTRTEVLEALGHDWDEGKQTKAPDGMTDGELTYICRRCRETRIEKISAAPGIFALLRGTQHEAVGEDNLSITQDPEGGLLDHESDGLTLTVEAEGGVQPYSYEWHCVDESHTEQGALIDFVMRQFKKTEASYYATSRNIAEAFRASISGDHFSEAGVTALNEDESAVQTPLTMKLNDHIVSRGGSPDFEATKGSCEYYCIVRDKAGNAAVSAHAVVGCHLYIIQQPQNTDLDGKDSVRLTCVAGGSSPDAVLYWLKTPDGRVIAGNLHEGSALVTEPGEYLFEVDDVNSGETITSDIVTVRGT